MKSDELKAIESATAVIENVHLVYRKSEADKVIAELKAREDVLVTDNRNLLDKVKKLENLLRENAEHFKRNESQIIENADKVIAHQKYKRCLAMAEACMHKRWRPDEGFDYARSTRQMNKYMELAEKFKEAK